MSKVTSICGTPRGARRNVGQIEFADGLVVARKLALALQDMDFHARLVVAGGRENFRFARRDGRVALDQSGEHAAQRLDAERERRHVQQQHVLDFALEHAGLDGRADGDDFVRVHALVRRFADQRLARSPPPAACGSCRRRARARRSCRLQCPASLRQALDRPNGALEQVVA